MERNTIGTAREYLVLDDQSLVRQCDVDTYRASGPGGQKRNKTDSAVRLRHGATGTIVTATEERSQHDNKARAVRRLRMAIALSVRSTVDVSDYAPGELLATCISSDGRLCVGRRDTRYPLAVAELLDVLAACGARVGEAADCVGVSTGGLVKFFENDRPLWRHVNHLRESEGIKPLR